MIIWYELASSPYFIIGSIVLIILGVSLQYYWRKRQEKRTHQLLKSAYSSLPGEVTDGLPMVGFDAVTGFQTQSVEDVCQAVLDYLTGYQVSAEVIPVTKPLNHSDITYIFQPEGDWITVWWPNYFCIHDFPLARALAADKNWLVSTIHVYDRDYWEHLCCFGKEELHAFCSRPDYWKNDRGDDYTRIKQYDSNPDRLAQALGVDSERIDPYLVNMDKIHDPALKAHEGDEFPLADYHVLIDFWRSLGIPYPDQVDIKAAIELGDYIAGSLPVV